MAMEGAASGESGRVTEVLENGWEVNENGIRRLTWRSDRDWGGRVSTKDAWQSTEGYPTMVDLS
jgi:hypothetical protein